MQLAAGLDSPQSGDSCRTARQHQPAPFNKPTLKTHQKEKDLLFLVP